LCIARILYDGTQKGDGRQLNGKQENGVDSNVHTNAEQMLYKPSIVQCRFLGQWKFQTEARNDSLTLR